MKQGQILQKTINSIESGYKSCKNCNDYLPHKDFPIHKGFKDGRRSVCKPCKVKIEYQQTMEKRMKLGYKVLSCENCDYLFSPQSNQKLCLKCRNK